MVVFLFSVSHSLIGQSDDLIYTRSFTQKLLHFNIDFFQPIERWLHITPTTEDAYMNYDAVFHDEAELEVRVKFIDVKKAASYHPHIELTRLMADIATNDQNEDILIHQMNREWVNETYNADWGVFVDFAPKLSYSQYPKGRVLCLYKEERALIHYIILYGDEELDPYFEMPLNFVSDSSVNKNR